MQSFAHIFVTVGTTHFDGLLHALSTEQTARAIIALGCTRLTIQTGNGGSLDVNRFAREIPAVYGDIVDVQVFAYRPSIAPFVQSADLIISHAGAGSCLEALAAGKTLLVVVNETLMDNHQLELAERLHGDGHIFRCVPADLASVLLNPVGQSTPEPYRPGNVDGVLRAIDELMNVK